MHAYKLEGTYLHYLPPPPSSHLHFIGLSISVVSSGLFCFYLFIYYLLIIFILSFIPSFLHLFIYLFICAYIHDINGKAQSTTDSNSLIWSLKSQIPQENREIKIRIIALQLKWDQHKYVFF